MRNSRYIVVELMTPDLTCCAQLRQKRSVRTERLFFLDLFLASRETVGLISWCADPGAKLREAVELRSCCKVRARVRESRGNGRIAS